MTKQYDKRNAWELDQQGGYYIRHVGAMTKEDLYYKSDIAAELAWRDYQIDLLTSSNFFQSSVAKWIEKCMGIDSLKDKNERSHRFLEEALELVQSTGCTKDEAHQLVEYVFNRDVGETSQEIGGVMCTLAALCESQNLDMGRCGIHELDRVNNPVIMEKVRTKQRNKPKFSPLPGSAE